MAIEPQKYCEKCHRTMSIKEFYRSNNEEKYPDGYLNQCKKCMTMFVDNWNPQTYLWILQEADVPYIPEEWDKLLASYGKDKTKITGMTIIGRYFSKMRLKQFQDFRWNDTERLQELADKKTEEAMKRQGYGAIDIATVINDRKIIIPEEGFVEPEAPEPTRSLANEGYFDDRDEDEDLDLTPEDRTMLKLKWGKSYKPEEWVRLEQLYQEMCESYDIQGAGHEDILKLVCKTSLKANQLIDMGDVDGAQKMLRMYDSLMKSGKFTAAQNKANEDGVLNSISELVMICEKEGFIERYYTDGPKDRVDETIRDMKDYTRSLVVEEMNLGNLIENAVKEMAAQEAKEEDEDVDEDLSFEEIEALKDSDYLEFSDFIDAEHEEDLEEFNDGSQRFT